MNVYFSASIVGKKHYIANYQKIIDLLTKKGFMVQSDHILKTSEEDIRIEAAYERRIFHKKLDKWISSCDFMVAEVSFPSISVGFEISMALHKGKSVLVLYSEGEGPSLLTAHFEDRLICEKYTAYTLSETIDDFLRYFSGNSDTRFTFYLTSEMNSHLDKISKKERVPKAGYLRKLIQKDILDHK